ncbi:MAG: histidine kinase N-terminal 7TM domain-containing protein [Bacillota bacterium]
MKYQFIPYAWVLLASALVSLLIGLFVWRRRSVPGAPPFIILMVCSVAWSLSNALEMMGTNLPTKIFWANVQYICYNIIPVTWLVLTLQYTRRDRWLTRRRLGLLLIIPILTVIFAWTNDWHGLMRRNIFLDTSGPFPVVGKTYGPWFWVFSAYSYPLMITACVIHLKATLRMQRIYRWQTLALLTGLLLPLIANLSFTFKISPFKQDIAPTLFSIGGIFYTLGLFRYKLFDILPAGRHLVIESIGDGMIIFDKLNRIVDFNPSAGKIFGVSDKMIGQTAELIFKDYFHLEEILRTSSMGHREIAVMGIEGAAYYDARWWPIPDRQGQIIGRLLLFHDITEIKNAQQEILRQQRFTAMLEERGKLARELHDSLGQVFGYINVQAQAVRKFMSAGQLELADDYLQKMIGAAKEAHAEVRGFIQDGMNPVLTEKGLFPTIEDLLKKFGDDYGIETFFYDSRQIRQGLVDPPAEAQILRIVQEALNNIRKHAEADQVRITIEDAGAGIRLTIADNGKGFAPDQVSGLKSFGLRIMHERAAEAGSRLSVISAPGRGTRVLIEIPYGGDAGSAKRDTGEVEVLSFPTTHLPPPTLQIRAVSTMKVLLVDDHTLFLDGLSSLLAASQIEVVGTARDGLEALQKARELKPDIIVMDIQMPGCDGLIATRLIKAELPRTKIIMLTTSETDEVLFEAIKSGASGYLLKDLDGDDFIELLLGLERGEVPLSPGIAARFLNEFRRTRNENAAASPESQKINEELTPRQIEILTMAAGGMTYKEIGASLCLTERGVKYHMGEIVAKLQLKDRHQAITLARKAGLIRE